jgi:hypothetical protein
MTGNDKEPSKCEITKMDLIDGEINEKEIQISKYPKNDPPVEQVINER